MTIARDLRHPGRAGALRAALLACVLALPPLSARSASLEQLLRLSLEELLGLSVTPPSALATPPSRKPR